jgi:hypothetical protein
MSTSRTNLGPLAETALATSYCRRHWVGLTVFCLAQAILAHSTAVQGQEFGEFFTDQQSSAADRSDSSKLGTDSIFGGDERLPEVRQGRLSLPPISASTTATDTIGNGSLPKSFASEETSAETPLLEQISQRDPQWGWSSYQFVAANTFSHPLYFEDVMLERHGHERFPLLQPMVSGTRFIATVPMLPYLMTVRPPCDIEYKMGHFRAGDRVYPYLQRPPYVRDAAIVEAAAIAGGIIALP